MTELEHYVFLDMSYIVFHKYYALISWMKLSQKELTEDEIKLKMESNLELYLNKVKKQLEVNTFENVYIVYDTRRHLIWRNEFFTQYKQNRTYDSVITGIFEHIYTVILPSLQAKLKIKSISVKTAEADDIIAVSCKYIREKDQFVKISILTNDNDYIQLIPLDVNIINASFQSLRHRFNEDILSVYTEWKVIKGDKSDNIPSIDTRIGDKTAFKLAKNPDLLANKLKDKKVLEQYNLNKLLIDFNSIPEHIKIEIIENLSALLAKS